MPRRCHGQRDAEIRAAIENMPTQSGVDSLLLAAPSRHLRRSVWSRRSQGNGEQRDGCRRFRRGSGDGVGLPHWRPHRRLISPRPFTVPPVSCVTTGAAGAPKRGDKAVWHQCIE